MNDYPFHPLLNIIFILAAIMSSCVNYHNGEPSEHFDGSRFFGTEPDHTFMDMVKWFWEMETVEWPEWIDDPDQPTPMEHVGCGNLRITDINHATVLIQM